MAEHFLANPGFELGNRDWSLQADWSIVNNALAARNGAWVAQSTGLQSIKIQSGAHRVRPGSVITAAAWFDTSNITSGGGQVLLRWLDQAFVTISFSVGSVVAQGNSYTQSTVTGIAPDRAKTVLVEAQNASDIVGGTLFVDDFTASGNVIEQLPASADIQSNRLVRADTVGRFDPLVGSDKFGDFNSGMSDRWAGVYNFVPRQSGANLNELIAFALRLGRTDRFFAFDPDRTTPVNGVVNNMVVDGPVAPGTNRIPVRSGPVDSTALIAGDYVEVRDQYFRLQRSLQIGPEGTGEMVVWPAVRSTIADAEDVITDNPKMVARITSDLDWVHDADTFARLSISWEEV